MVKKLEEFEAFWLAKGKYKDELPDMVVFLSHNDDETSNIVSKLSKEHGRLPDKLHQVDPIRREIQLKVAK